MQNAILIPDRPRQYRGLTNYLMCIFASKNTPTKIPKNNQHDSLRY